MRTRGALLPGCLAVAALSLLAPWALAFDPYAWLVWGREIAHGSLDTSAGPSWKPLPMLFTVPLGIAGADGAAEATWLVVARTGALLALAGAAALAARLCPGRAAAAGAAAALVLALSPWWWFNAALGNSEGLLAAAVLWAGVAHLAERPRAALAALLAGSLIRPEAWPFLGLYGLWLFRARPDRTTRALIAAAFVAIPLLWFVPGALGGGGASSAAQGTPSTGSAVLADVPFLAVLGDAVELLTIPAAIALALALALRDRRARWLAGCAAAYVVIVAVMTQAGYAGNPRYLVPAAALGAALAAAGAVRLGRAPLALLLVVAVGAFTLDDLRDQTREVGVRADSRRGLDALDSRACGRVVTSVPQRTAVAWKLDVPIPRVRTAPAPGPATILRARPYGGGELEPAGAGQRVGTAPRWELWRRC